MSTHEVLVVRIPAVEEHPNAHSLEIIPLYNGGFTAIARKGEFKVGDLAIFIEPDYVVPPDAEMFAFLEKKRITCKKLRGVRSQGLLLPALPGMVEGENVMERLGIVRYVPRKAGGRYTRTAGLDQAESELAFRNSGTVPAPQALNRVQKYDIESVRKFVGTFTPGEEIIATEKIHGANARFSFVDGQQFCGSRTQWKRPPTPPEPPAPPEGIFRLWVRKTILGLLYWLAAKGVATSRLTQLAMRLQPRKRKGPVAPDMWWSVFQANPWIQKFCAAHPAHVLFGEVFGQVQDLKYGAGPKDVFFRVFDVLDATTGKWWSHDDLEKVFTEEQRCPVVYRGGFDFTLLKELSLGDSKVPGAKHLSEGLVIRPVQERNTRGHRAVMKLVSDRYLEKATGEDKDYDSEDAPAPSWSGEAVEDGWEPPSDRTDS